MQSPIARRPAQRGIALIVMLIFFVVLSAIGIFLTRRANLELKMTNNAVSKAITFERAEGAVNDAETAANSAADLLSGGGAFNCTTGRYAVSGAPNAAPSCKALDASQLAWNATDSIASGNGRYAIEYQGIVESVLPEDRFTLPPKTTPMHVFRIVTQSGEIGSGGQTSIETIYLRRHSG